MREIKKLKFQEPHKFKRKANEDQYKFNLKLAETFDSAKSAAEKSNLEKVKSDLDEGEKLLVERQKHILLADKSEFGWSTVEEYKQHDLADDSEDEKRIYSAERRARVVMSSWKKKKSSAMGAIKRSSPLRGLVSASSSQSQTQSYQPASGNSGFLPRRPNIGTYFACGKTGNWRACCPAMTKQSGSPTSKWLDEQDLSGVVLSCFDRNEFILEVLSDSQRPDSSSDPISCNVLLLVLSSFLDQQCFADIDPPAQPSVRGRLGKCIDFWRSLEVSQFILNVIIQGYKISFFHLPTPFSKANNASAFCVWSC